MNTSKLFYRSLVRQKTISFITIGGFAISLSMIIIMGSFLLNELSFDNFHHNINNIYRVLASDNYSGIPEETKTFLNEVPGIEASARYMNNGQPLVKSGDKLVKSKIFFTEPDFFKIFSTHTISGNPESALFDKHNMVITKSFAEKLFGDENPIGKTLRIDQQEDVVISAVIEDFPVNSSISFDLLGNYQLNIYREQNCNNDDCISFQRLFILTNKNVSKENLEKQISEKIKMGLGQKIDRLQNFKSGVKLLAYSDSYLNNESQNSQLSHANIKLIVILLIITILIAILAIFNYINLTTALFFKRYKEVGVKKTFGAGRKNIFQQFMVESFMIIFLAFITGMCLSKIISPFFDIILGKTIEISNLFTFKHILLSFIFICILTLISGIYPAIFLARLKPISIFSNSVNNFKGIQFKSAFVIFQFIISIVLIISLFFITKQIEFVRNKDFGFKTEQLIKIELHWKIGDKIPLLKNKLSVIPSITGITSSQGAPGAIYSYSKWWNEKEYSYPDAIPHLSVDTNFFELFKVPVVQGRRFGSADNNKSVMINESALKIFGWKSIEGQKIMGKQVVGLVKDFHLQSMHDKIKPALFDCSGDMGRSHLTVRIRPDNIPVTMASMQKAFKEICPDNIFEYTFYNEWLNSMYQEEENLAYSIKIFGIIALIISCLGMYGMARFAALNRTKEIGIRKVNGAKSIELLAMLNKSFLIWIGISFLISCPIAYYAMNQWLQNFAYKTELSWWVFAVAGIVALVIALFTVSWQSWRAASRNPVEALRYE